MLFVPFCGLNSQTLLDESLRLWDALGNDERRAVCLQTLGNVTRFRGDLHSARRLFEEASQAPDAVQSTVPAATATEGAASTGSQPASPPGG